VPPEELRRVLELVAVETRRQLSQS
jgi:hypothetical protein